MTIKWNDLTMKRIVAPIVSLFFFKETQRVGLKGFAVWRVVPFTSRIHARAWLAFAYYNTRGTLRFNRFYSSIFKELHCKNSVVRI